MNKVNQLLKQIDLSDAEIKVYMALLKSTAGLSVISLSQKLSMPRPTVYGYINSLAKKGLVIKSWQNESSIYIAEDIDVALNLFDEKISSLTFAKNEFKKHSSQLARVEDYDAKFAIYNNAQAPENILRDILRSKEKDIYWFWPFSDMLKTIPEDVLHNFHEERINREIWINTLWPASKKATRESYSFLGGLKPTEKVFMRRVRILPKGVNPTLAYGIYGDKIAFLSSKKENYGFTIKSKELRDTMKSQFDFLWKHSMVHKI